MKRQHRLQAAYPRLWRIIDGAVRDAVTAHPDIIISDWRRASVVKRIVGSVLALQGAGAGAGALAETAESAAVTCSAIGESGIVEGLGQLLPSPKLKGGQQDDGDCLA